VLCAWASPAAALLARRERQIRDALCELLSCGGRGTAGGARARRAPDPAWRAPWQEMSENLEVVREVWGMHLAAQRNRIIRINLAVTVGAFALTACIVPASFFGMNLPHGLEARACERRALFRGRRPPVVRAQRHQALRQCMGAPTQSVVPQQCR